MSYEDALTDLKEEVTHAYGGRALHMQVPIGSGLYAESQTVLHCPIAQDDIGGHIVVSIYALARFVGEDDADEAAPKPATSPKPAKPSAKSAKGIDKFKPIFHPPSLGKTLSVFRKRVINTALQLKFQQALLSDVEACILDMTAAPGRPKKSKSA